MIETTKVNKIINFILAVVAFLLIVLFWIFPIILTWKHDNKGFLWIYVVYYMILRILYKLAIKKL